MKLSLNIGSREFSLGFGKKSFSDFVKAFTRGDDASPNGGADLRSAYQQSVWVYGCISAIAEQVAQIPFRFSRAEAVPLKARKGKWRRKSLGEAAVETGPVVELFNRPHPHLTRFQFWELLVAWLQYRGEFFCAPVRNGKTVRSLVVLPPDSFQEVVRFNQLLGWRYTGNSQAPLETQGLLPEEIITDRLANPYDFWRGMSPISVAKLAASSDFAAAQFMKGLMLNNADTGVIVRTEQQLDEAQREQLLAALNARKRKAGTADRPLLLWGGAEVVKPQLSSADMQFLESRKFNRQEICTVFKVPQEILGWTEDANRSVSDSARLNFIENRIAPICERLEAAFDPFIKSIDPTLWGWFDIDCLAVMQKARRERYAGAVQAFGMGVPIDDCSEIFDLGLPENLPHAGKSYLPFSLQEIGSSPENTEDVPPAEDSTDPQHNTFARAERLFAELKATPAAPPHVCAPNPEYEASIQGSVKLKKGALQKFFFEQRSRVLTALAKETAKAVTGKSIEDVFNLNDENTKLIGKLRARLIADLEFGGAQLFREIGANNFTLPPTEALAFLEQRANPIKKINETTWTGVKQSLQEGIAAGESFEQLANRVKAQYNNASEQRADTIAATETNIAVNSGRHTAMVQAKVARKGWQTSNLENTRQSHFENQQHSQKEGGIPLTDKWPNGLSFPGDPEGAPGETINCRCFGYAVANKSAAVPVKLLRFEEWAQGRAKATEASE